MSDYIELFNKKFAKEKDVDYDYLYENLSLEREFAVRKLYHERRRRDDEAVLTELRQLPLHKQIIEYYNQYQLDYFQVKDIQDLRNYLKFSEIKFLNREEVQEQIKKDILQCAFKRGDDLMIRGVKEDLLPLLEFFIKIKL